MDAVSNVRDLTQVADLLKGHDNFLIVPHVQPDPDAYGSTCALALMLTQLGKTVTIFSDEEVPASCGFINAYFPVVHTLPDNARDLKLIFVDGGERTREPGPVREWPTWMNLDHHLDNGLFAEWIYVDTEAAASALVIARLIDPLDVTLDEPIASCLFAGLLFDTRGGFITNKCNEEVFAVTSRLVAAGARPDHINRQMNEQMSLGDFKLYGAALASLGTAHDGQVVYCTLTQAMMRETGGSDQAMEMLTLNLPKIAGGEMYVLLRENEEGVIKISLRSKGRLAVNEVAKQFNGGGHKFAAGARHPGPIEAATAALVAACAKAIDEQTAASGARG